MFSKESMKQVWNLVNDEKVPMKERIVLCTTFDNCLIAKEDIPKVIEAFKAFDGNTNLQEQADVLEDIYNDENCIAVGIHQNSSSCQQWYNYNCLKQNDHFYVSELWEKEDENKTDK